MNAMSKTVVPQKSRSFMRLQQMDAYAIAVERAIEGLAVAADNMSHNPSDQEYKTLCVMAAWALDTLRAAAAEVEALNDAIEAAEGEAA